MSSETVISTRASPNDLVYRHHKQSEKSMTKYKCGHNVGRRVLID